jgi:ribosomal protein S18 acetylase RimI-like enzyme
MTVSLDLDIRPGRSDDLPALEWWGLFAPHRALIRATFEATERGEAIMLVADANGMAVGQAWVDLCRARSEDLGALWAIRVLPCLQGLGIGTALVRACEKELRARSIGAAEVTVEQENGRARQLYERLGYRCVGLSRAEHPPETACEIAAGRGRVTEQWRLIKSLVHEPPRPPSRPGRERFLQRNA